MKNYRQVITDTDITSNKSFDDIIWNYLQRVSHKIGEGRWIQKADCQFNRVGEDLGIDRRKVSKTFQFMKEAGLIIDRDNSWEIAQPKGSIELNAATIDTLEQVRMRGLITVYGFLWSLWQSNRRKRFVIRINALKGRIGISTSTRSNNSKVMELLNALRWNGLIASTPELKDGKTSIWIDSVKEEIELDDSF